MHIDAPRSENMCQINKCISKSKVIKLNSLYVFSKIVLPSNFTNMI